MPYAARRGPIPSGTKALGLGHTTSIPSGRHALPVRGGRPWMSCAVANLPTRSPVPDALGAVARVPFVANSTVRQGRNTHAAVLPIPMRRSGCSPRLNCGTRKK